MDTVFLFKFFIKAVEQIAQRVIIYIHAPLIEPLHICNYDSSRTHMYYDVNLYWAVAEGNF